MKTQVMVTPDLAAPKGVKCLECNLTAKPGQIIIVNKQANVGWFLWHKVCMENILRFAPDDLDKTVDEQYNQILEMMV